ncbi:unnamed protein product [Thlaspi arvense]|uniref:Uncharacterized protein n=1 Tax=Thlaspi arvense TaxID=13288 RepID=A0AAU9RV48_THLAR|nr:unnamed protein product [Thlaspi arvense]
MESKLTSGVIRRKPPSSRYYPYATRRGSAKESMMKDEVVRLGVELSLSVAESMFLLCGDNRALFCFGYKLSRHVLPHQDPVLERLHRVFDHISLKDLKSKNGVCNQNGIDSSVRWSFIRNTWKDFVFGTIILHRLVIVLRKKDLSFDERMFSSFIAKYKKVLSNIEDKLRPFKNVSEANGYLRETQESDIFHLWKSLFDEEAFETTRRVIKSPYNLGRDSAKKKLEKEAVRLGVELSLYVAQSMFLLCDDIRSMLIFCFKLWRDAKNDLNPNSPVAERLLRLMHYIYLKDVKPRNGVYQNETTSVQLELAGTTWRNFEDGFTYLDLVVLILRGEEENCLYRREFTSSIEEEVKSLEEKLRSVKAVSEANGFKREAIKCSISEMWKSLFDKEAKEASQTLRVIKNGILRDLFLPLLNE